MCTFALFLNMDTICLSFLAILHPLIICLHRVGYAKLKSFHTAYGLAHLHFEHHFICDAGGVVSVTKVRTPKYGHLGVSGIGAAGPCLRSIF